MTQTNDKTCREAFEHLQKMIDWTIVLSGDKLLTTLKWDIARAEAAIAAMGDASTRKDEGVCTSTLPVPESRITSSANSCEMVDNPLVEIMLEVYNKKENLYNAPHEDITAMLEAIRPYLRTTEPDSGETSSELYERLSKRAKLLGMKLCPIEPVSLTQCIIAMDNAAKEDGFTPLINGC